MAVLVPYINPIRLKPRGVDIDYNNQFPIFDLMTQREDYQRGVIAQKSYYPDFLVNKEIQLEVFSDASTVEFIVTLPSGSTVTQTATNITPTGWKSEDIWVIKYTPTSTGVYKISVDDRSDIYESDEFLVKSGENQDLVELRWQDSQNRLDLGGGFYSGDNGDWEPRAYFTGIKRKIVAPTEVSTYVDEPGNPRNLQFTGSKAEQVTLTDIHETYIDVIEEIVKVDTIYINGQLITISELSAEPIEEKTDMYNITFTAIRADNDGYFNYG